jgi:hypothetical protein
MAGDVDADRLRILTAMIVASADSDVDGYAELYDELIQLEKTAGEFDEIACRVCGCTEDNACPGGCSWAGPELCSRCAAVLIEAGIIEVEEEQGWEAEDGLETG